MKLKYLLILLGALPYACSDTGSFDREKEVQAILKLHHSQRTYHFSKDSVGFVDQLAREFISVNKGKIAFPSRQEMLARYNSYFSSVDFIRWDDVNEPIIRFSADGTLAYTVVDKIVKLTYQDHVGKSVEEETHFAWTAIYRKYDDEWKIECVTSTDQPR